jgi:hypothetical protein
VAGGCNANWKTAVENVRWAVALRTALLFMLCLLLDGRALPRAGRATVQCYDSLEERGFCEIQTTRAFYNANNLPVGLCHPNLAVLFLEMSTGHRSTSARMARRSVSCSSRLSDWR